MLRRTSIYGSFVSVDVFSSGMKGGLPPVDQNVPGVGNARPNANWVSRLASTPASETF